VGARGAASAHFIHSGGFGGKQKFAVIIFTKKEEN
jgi:hypothetical protein